MNQKHNILATLVSVMIPSVSISNFAFLACIPTGTEISAIGLRNCLKNAWIRIKHVSH